MTEQDTRRVQARPFGADKSHALMVRNEAIRTLSRQECFDKGYITVKDLDDEELRYGRCRDFNTGLIPGRDGKKTQLIPQDKYDAMVAEHELRFKQKLRQQLDTALDTMVDIMGDDTVEPRDRFEAAKYLFERTAGKTPETVNVTVKQAPWESVMSDITGVGNISRSEHRRMQQEGHNAGIIDVEFADEDIVQPEGVPPSSQAVTQQTLVQVHKPRPDNQPEQPDDNQYAENSTPEGMGQEPDDEQPRNDGYHSGAPPTDQDRDQTHDWAPVDVDTPDPYEQYGSRRTEAKTYADQVHDADALAKRRKEAKDRIRQAKKSRIIARTMGADAIKTEITGATLGEDGKLTFD